MTVSCTFILGTVCLLQPSGESQRQIRHVKVVALFAWSRQVAGQDSTPKGPELPLRDVLAGLVHQDCDSLHGR
jgi:hypothetical protein